MPAQDPATEQSTRTLFASLDRYCMQLIYSKHSGHAGMDCCQLSLNEWYRGLAANSEQVLLPCCPKQASNWPEICSTSGDVAGYHYERPLNRSRPRRWPSSTFGLRSSRVGWPEKRHLESTFHVTIECKTPTSGCRLSDTSLFWLFARRSSLIYRDGIGLRPDWHASEHAC